MDKLAVQAGRFALDQLTEHLTEDEIQKVKITGGDRAKMRTLIQVGQLHSDDERAFVSD